MALVTTCPACQSSFFVKPEQLAAHRGDVRCGKCQHVFNALSALNQLDASPSEASSASAPQRGDINEEVIAQTEALVSETIQSEIQEAIEEATQATSEHFDIGELTAESPTIEAEANGELTPLAFETPDSVPDSTGFVITKQDYASDDPMGDSSAESNTEANEATSALASTSTSDQNTIEHAPDGAEEIDSDAQARLEDVKESNAEPETLANIDTAYASDSDAQVDEEVRKHIEAPASEPKRINVGSGYTGTFADPVFIEEEFGSKRKAWLTPVLIVLFILLSVVAAAQVIYFYRTEISARWPQTAPYLKQACKVLHCSIPLPHDITSMVIDDSEIEEDKTRQGLIHLHTTLINTSNFAQRYPVLELTLTDKDDHAKIRRPFEPQEYLPPATAVDLGMPAGEELHITLSMTTDNEPLSGYRVFVHY